MDKKKALKYCTMAADNGHAAAQYNCGNMYYNGEGVERDVEEALRWFDLAATQDHQQAQQAQRDLALQGESARREI